MTGISILADQNHNAAAARDATTNNDFRKKRMTDDSPFFSRRCCGDDQDHREQDATITQEAKTRPLRAVKILIGFKNIAGLKGAPA